MVSRLPVTYPCYLYCAPVKYSVRPDCRPPARYFPGDTTVNPGGLQYIYCIRYSRYCSTVSLREVLPNTPNTTSSLWK